MWVCCSPALARTSKIKRLPVFEMYSHEQCVGLNGPILARTNKNAGLNLGLKFEFLRAET